MADQESVEAGRSRFWVEHNEHKATLNQHEIRLALAEDRMDRMHVIAAKFDDLSTDIRELNKSILTLELEAKHGKGVVDALLTKWVPALTAIAVVYLSIKDLTP